MKQRTRLLRSTDILTIRASVYIRGTQSLAVKIAQYTRSDIQIMLGILIPFSILLNTILYGETLYQHPFSFSIPLLTTLAYKCFFWQFHTMVAVYLRRKMPSDKEIMKRIGTSLLCFFIMTAFDTTLLVSAYRYLHFCNFEFSTSRYLTSIFAGITLNIFATLFHEGTSNFEKWKSTLTQTEQLKTEYLKTQVDGLKGQIQPHFLFNSINTLSALIGENSERANVFLDELCKVYRYLLRQDGQFTELNKELRFIKSYFHILQARYGKALQLSVSVESEELMSMVPPLTLHLLIEDILQQNIISKKNPLFILIQSGTAGSIAIRNNVIKKETAENEEGGLKNIIAKFRLLGLEEIKISYLSNQRTVLVPVLKNTLLQ